MNVCLKFIAILDQLTIVCSTAPGGNQVYGSPWDPNIAAVSIGASLSPRKFIQNVSSIGMRIRSKLSLPDLFRETHCFDVEVPFPARIGQSCFKMLLRSGWIFHLRWKENNVCWKKNPNVKTFSNFIRIINWSNISFSKKLIRIDAYRMNDKMRRIFTHDDKSIFLCSNSKEVEKSRRRM